MCKSTLADGELCQSSSRGGMQECKFFCLSAEICGFGPCCSTASACCKVQGCLVAMYQHDSLARLSVHCCAPANDRGGICLTAFDVCLLPFLQQGEHDRQGCECGVSWILPEGWRRAAACCHTGDRYGRSPATRALAPSSIPPAPLSAQRSELMCTSSHQMHDECTGL